MRKDLFMADNELIDLHLLKLMHEVAAEKKVNQ